MDFSNYFNMFFQDLSCYFVHHLSASRTISRMLFIHLFRLSCSAFALVDSSRPFKPVIAVLSCCAAADTRSESAGLCATENVRCPFYSSPVRCVLIWRYSNESWATAAVTSDLLQ